MMKVQKEEYLPFRSFMQALLQARSFIHFTSYGITQLMIGILKMAAQHVRIRGIVSGNVGEQIISEVTIFSNEAPKLEIIFCESYGFRNTDIPHQKLVVIDGLLAFKGSANLTQMAWRSAAKNTDMIDVVSNIDEVINLHNRFFSSIWGKMSKIGEEVVMKHFLL
jgi:phosphatidylserine/phosphatidylglycerophosphate/cardiolipin synthase-like enzyme